MAASTFKFVLSALGVFCFFLIFGLFQEKINRGIYKNGDKEERFQYTLTLVLCQCSFGYLFSLLISKTITKSEDDKTSPVYYSGAAMTYLIAMVCSNKALSWVSYPTQVIGKSCKPIPTMVLGALLAQKKYPVQKYLFIFMIVIGVGIFMYNPSKSKNSDGSGFGTGEFLLLLSLLCDGLTGTIQEKMRTNFSTSSTQMMMKMNMMSVLFLGIATILSGEVFAFLGFIQRHPSVILQLVAFASTSALGQYCIYLLVVDFGPLVCSIVTTVRKFFTILGSVLLFGSTLSGQQWAGTAMVFSGLFLDAVYGKTKKTTKS